MYKQVACVLALSLVLCVGCTKDDPGSGGKKAAAFTMKGPEAATTVKHGETQAAKLTLNRGKDFKEDVALSTGDLPKGIKVEFAPATLKGSDKAEAEIKITADKDASPGDAVIPVIAKPAKGDSTTLSVKVKIEKGAE